MLENVTLVRVLSKAVKVFLVLFTMQNTIWDSFTKRMFSLDKHKISPEFLCYLVDNVDKSV